MSETGIPPDAKPRPRCPRCGGARTKPIVYGFVDAGSYLELGRRTPDFELGGLTPRAESWCCTLCEYRWPGRAVTGS